MMKDDKNTESVFNMAIAYLSRIHYLLNKCQESAFSQDIDSWRLFLRAVYRELSVKLSDIEKKEIDGDYMAKLDLNKLLDLNITSSEATFANINRLANNAEIKIKHRTIILYLLDELEIKIRGKLQQKGMLLPSRDNPNYAVLRR